MVNGRGAGNRGLPHPAFAGEKEERSHGSLLRLTTGRETQAGREDIAFRVITADHSQTYATIARFRQGNVSRLEALFRAKDNSKKNYQDKKTKTSYASIRPFLY
jgi:hypothetical protein